MGFFGGGGGGVQGSGTANTIAKFVNTQEIGHATITENVGADGVVNIPVLSGGPYNAPFFSAPETGFVLQGTQPPGASYTPNGLLAVNAVADDGAASVSGAVIGVFDTRVSGEYGVDAALNLDALKTGNGNALLLNGLSIFVWNQGAGTLGSLEGAVISLESDAGVITGDVNGLRIGGPFLPGTVNGRSSGIFIANQSAIAGGGAFAIYYAAPDDNTFSVAADGHLQVGATLTPPGTTGAQTINKSAGSVNFAIGAGSLVVTCDKCTANSLVFAVVATNDATAGIKNVVPASGSFTIRLTAIATAQTRVNFWVLNQ